MRNILKIVLEKNKSNSLLQKQSQLLCIFWWYENYGNRCLSHGFRGRVCMRRNDFIQRCLFLIFNTDTGWWCFLRSTSVVVVLVRMCRHTTRKNCWVAKSWQRTCRLLAVSKSQLRPVRHRYDIVEETVCQWVITHERRSGQKPSKQGTSLKNLARKPTKKVNQIFSPNFPRHTGVPLPATRQ